MTTFVLIPGADGRAWYWHRLVPALESRGHRAVPVDLPLEGTSTLSTYVDAAVDQVGSGHDDLVVVGQSIGGFSSPLVCESLDAQRLVLLNAMIPNPGETAGDWWDNVGQDKAQSENAVAHGRPAEFDLRRDFFHDVPDDVTEEAFAAADGMADLTSIWTDPWPLQSWPEVQTHILQATDDRFFPLSFQQRVARDRLQINEIDTMPGGHLVALSQPEILADRLSCYATA
ncbi:alpha/beta fold hydrolase [Luteipulveratus mongoliensis]|uniref:Alpha/beta hydrolase n=1 Tax=Luteipulveratus mongoliensis TaxID=571913 RepID=A0A0K1JPK1_9MICO|nr:alpha/beta hydrolase [Luteipulveratus mongoliensis]AKU18495.1 alpha/beta hydrolase [Luteipulveratus mongoliensis]AKU19316.1 alpha/beta hydrolase [Luteipulveratus mongoliensis]